MIKVWRLPWLITSWIDGDTCHGMMDKGWGNMWTPKRGLRLVLADGGKFDAPERKTRAAHVAALASVNELAPIGDWYMVTSHSGEPDAFSRPLCSIELPGGRDLATVMVNLGHVK